MKWCVFELRASWPVATTERFARKYTNEVVKAHCAQKDLKPSDPNHEETKPKEIPQFYKNSINTQVINLWVQPVILASWTLWLKCLRIWSILHATWGAQTLTTQGHNVQLFVRKCTPVHKSMHLQEPPFCSNDRSFLSTRVSPCELRTWSSASKLTRISQSTNIPIK